VWGRCRADQAADELVGPPGSGPPDRGVVSGTRSSSGRASSALSHIREPTSWCSGILVDDRLCAPFVVTLGHGIGVVRVGDDFQWGCSLRAVMVRSLPTRAVLDDAYRRAFETCGMRMQQLAASGADRAYLAQRFTGIRDELTDLWRRAEAAAKPDRSQPAQHPAPASPTS